MNKKLDSFDTLLQGESPAFLSLLRATRIAAKTEVALLLLGESGTGKEVLARAIHAESLRKDKPFIAINCAALPESLAESELFGHRKGAFTGASEHALGRIRAADGGTLFLDEIGELPLSIQAKLLRFLESGECHSVGDSQPVKVNTRIVAATNRELQAEVKTGRFRKDLFYRLNIVPLQLPALRERHGDIDKLVISFTAQLARQHGLDAPRYSIPAIEQLQRYDWPGNVRELRNVMERACVLARSEYINLDMAFSEEAAPALGIRTDLPFKEAKRQLIAPFERRYIRMLYESHGANLSAASRASGVTRRHLRTLYRRYGFR